MPEEIDARRVDRVFLHDKVEHVQRILLAVLSLKSARRIRSASPASAARRGAAGGWTVQRTRAPSRARTEPHRTHHQIPVLFGQLRQNMIVAVEIEILIARVS